MHLSSNLKLLRTHKRLTQQELSDAMNISRSKLNAYENGHAQPTIDGLLQLSSYFKISIDNLLKIDMTKLSALRMLEIERGNEHYISGNKLRVLASTVDKSNRENVEVVPHKAKAGYRSGYADPEFISKLPRFQLPFLSNEKKYRCFQISGDSMLPVPAGAYVTGEFIQDWNELKNGTPVIVITREDGIVFKIANNLLKNEKMFELISLNPEYSPYKISAGEVLEIWKFVHLISSEIPQNPNLEDDILRAVKQVGRDVLELKEMKNKN